MASLKDLPTDRQIELYNRAIQTYALGEMAQDATFRNAVVDETIRMAKQFGNAGHPECIRTLCETVSHRSKLMRYFVDAGWAAERDDRSFRAWRKELPNDFVFEMACVAAEEKKMDLEKRLPSARERCFYHDHEGEKDKQNCQVLAGARERMTAAGW